MDTAVMFSSERADWETPWDLFEKYHKKYNFTLDVCATEENHKCISWLGHFRYVDGDIGFSNGLTHTWTGNCWMNPPYGDPEQPCKVNCKKKKCVKRGFHISEYQPGIIDWVKKAHDSVLVEGTADLVCCLLPARTDTRWFHQYIWDTEMQMPRHGVSVEFLPGRVKFLVNGEPADAAPFPSMIVVFQAEDGFDI